MKCAAASLSFLLLSLMLFRSANCTPRSVVLMDHAGWVFNLEGAGSNGSSAVNCSLDSTFPVDLNDKQCLGLTEAAQYADLDGCRQGCCEDSACEVFQWCPSSSTTCSPAGSCWMGKASDCKTRSPGWRSRSRPPPPPPPPPPPVGEKCTVPECAANFDDATWRRVELPHDFVVERNFSSTAADKSHGYLPYGVGWYRLHFSTPVQAEAGRSVRLRFDGAQRNSDVYLNSVMLGHHDSGYTGFSFEVAQHLIRDANRPNVLAVRVDATQPDGWWYDGGGIYRHVWLTVSDAVHIAEDGVFANVTVHSVSDDACDGIASVDAQTEVVNSGDTSAETAVVWEVLDANGSVVASASSPATSVAAGTNKTVRGILANLSVALWSDVHPRLYTLRTTLSSDEGRGDSTNTTFGFRKIVFDPTKGFLLNDRPTKLRGCANHQDFAGVGVAVPDSLQRFRIGKLKEMGANAWRTAHNPPTPALLDEADQLGMLIWDENHRNEVSGQFLDDLRAMLRRDRNHPSVVMWSICNEALCQNFDASHAKTLAAVVKTFDDGPNARPVTAAMNGDLNEQGEAFWAALDVVGINYHVTAYDTFHSSHPTTRLIGSETASALSDRGEYSNNSTTGYVSAYDVNTPSWGQTAEVAWQAVRERNFIAGTFVWTGFDYKGEPTPYKWPNINSHFGIIDVAGFPKDVYYYYQAAWRSDLHVVHAFPHWTWDAANCAGRCRTHPTTGEPIAVDVWAYSNTAFVELVLNNMTVGNRTAVPVAGHVEWDAVAYVPGTLECRGYDASGKLVASHASKTAGAPARLELELEQGRNGLVADHDDVALVKVSVVDSDGNLVPTAASAVRVDFAVSGPAVLIGVGNGDPSSHEPDKATYRTAWHGLARAIVQATNKPGMVSITATSPGLHSATVTVSVAL